jgi:hypothetical protein
LGCPAPLQALEAEADPRRAALRAAFLSVYSGQDSPVNMAEAVQQLAPLLAAAGAAVAMRGPVAACIAAAGERLQEQGGALAAQLPRMSAAVSAPSLLLLAAVLHAAGSLTASLPAPLLLLLLLESRLCCGGMLPACRHSHVGLLCANTDGRLMRITQGRVDNTM